MKFLNYEIKHTKDPWGNDQYMIYKVILGFIRIPFMENVINGLVRGRYKCSQSHIIYKSLDDARNSLTNYLNNPYEKYKGHVLYRCNGDMWIDFSNSIIYYGWTEYKIAGSLENAKLLIDHYEKQKTYKNFKERIKV